MIFSANECVLLSRLIDFLTEWEATQMPNTMEIAFMVERSIEDEIQRVSQTSAGIIILSYGIMLVYVSLALGRISSWKRIQVRNNAAADAAARHITSPGPTCALRPSCPGRH